MDEDTAQRQQTRASATSLRALGPGASPAPPRQPRISLYNVRNTRTRQSLHQLSRAHHPEACSVRVGLSVVVGLLFLSSQLCGAVLWPRASLHRAWLWILSRISPSCLRKNWAERANWDQKSFFGTSFGDKPKRPLKLKAM